MPGGLEGAVEVSGESWPLRQCAKWAVWAFCPRPLSPAHLRGRRCWM